MTTRPQTHLADPERQQQEGKGTESEVAAGHTNHRYASCQNASRHTNIVLILRRCRTTRVQPPHLAVLRPPVCRHRTATASGVPTLHHNHPRCTNPTPRHHTRCTSSTPRPPLHRTCVYQHHTQRTKPLPCTKPGCSSPTPYHTKHHHHTPSPGV